ncbi:MAG TPA: DUF4157 domain-containing protein [Thermoanaerobaculia bacterium]|nr:DUF4157 domain-containing protein [Thermoanaerobaculia bacterium]
MRTSSGRMTVPRPHTASAPAVLARRHPAPQAVPGIVHDVLRSAGEPLSSPVRSHMESRFGRDFSQVRVHTDERSAEASQAVGARAFTAGRSIVFGAGHYQPETGPGRTLLAHELTHVVQQSGTTGAPSQVGAAGDPAEREAHRVASSGGQVAVQPSFSRPIVQCDPFPPLYQPHPYFQDILDDFNKMIRNLGGGTTRTKAPVRPVERGRSAEMPNFLRKMPPPIKPFTFKYLERDPRVAGSPVETREMIQGAVDQRMAAQGDTLDFLNGALGGQVYAPGSTLNSIGTQLGGGLLNQVFKPYLPAGLELNIDLSKGGATPTLELLEFFRSFSKPNPGQVEQAP